MPLGRVAVHRGLSVLVANGDHPLRCRGLEVIHRPHDVEHLLGRQIGRDSVDRLPRTIIRRPTRGERDAQGRGNGRLPQEPGRASLCLRSCGDHPT